MLVNVNPEIFRQYDIRGVVGKDLTPDIANLIGRAFGTYLYSKFKIQNSKFKISVGRDVRLHSEQLADALINGIISIFGDAIQDIRRIIDAEDFKKGDGKKTSINTIPDYVDRLKKEFSPLINSKADIKVVVDAGNGTAGIIAPKLFEYLGCNIIKLFCEPDGRFPNHHPDPTVVENLKTLIDTVKSQNADAGIAFDGDADRLGVVDGNGNVIWGDILLLAFAKDIIERQKSKGKRQKEGKPTFVGEVKCSQVMYDEIEKMGGNAIMGKTGHSLIKQLMKEKGALLAGEMSGHMFFRDRYYGYDDAIYASLRLIELLSKDRDYIKNLISNMPKTFYTPEIRVDCPDNIKFKIIDGLGNVFQRDKDLLGIKDIITVDGLRVHFKDGWGLVRASNTQPVLVMRFEASSQDSLKKIQRIVEGKLKEEMI
ncbi:MAG: phosphomannomutase/phosphoglucomutase [Deltaproteobacteria bacterium]|nr:phosphomannomutase/phosphoglucomutase [Deltaproteobacteria bacterium]